jgi:hypothetical protein
MWITHLCFISYLVLVDKVRLWLRKLYYLLTQWSRVHLEKLTGLQLVKNFPTFYGTWRFITTFTSAHHLSLSWATSIQSITPHPTYWRFILILSSHLCLGLPSSLIPSGFPPKPCTRLSPPPYMLNAPPIWFFSILSPAQHWVRSTDHEGPNYEVFSTPLLPRPS